MSAMDEEEKELAHHEALVVEIVVIGSGPEREPVSERPGEVVSRVSVDSLEQSEGDPNVHGEDVQVVSEETVEERSRDGSLSENQDLQWMSVLGSETDGCAVGVVLLVNVLVQRSPV